MMCLNIVTKLRNIFTVLLLSICLLLSAQNKTNKSPKIYLGTTQGITLSTVGFSPNIAQDYKIFGYNGGFMFRYVDEKYTGLQVELNFSQRGWSESSRLYTRQINYLELPFLSHFHLGNKSRFIINAGPKIGLMLYEKELINLVGNSNSEQHIRPIQNKFDYGISLGLGYQLNVLKNAFEFETRLYYGLSDVYSNSKKDVFGRSNNMNLSVNLNWLFCIR